MKRTIFFWGSNKCKSSVYMKEILNGSLNLDVLGDETYSEAKKNMKEGCFQFPMKKFKITLTVEKVK